MKLDGELKKSLMSPEFQGVVSKVEGKHLVLVLGGWSSGKSTFINYVTGKIEYEVILNELDQPIANPVKFISTNLAETANPNAVGPTTLLPKSYDTDIDFSFLDTAGFEDARGDSERILASIGMEIAIKAAASIRAIIVMIPYTAIADKNNAYKNLTGIASILSRLLPKFDKVKGSIFYLINRYPPTYTPAKVKNLIALLIKDQHEKSKLQEFKDKLINKQDKYLERLTTFAFLSAMQSSNNILLLDICDHGKSRRDILDRVKKLQHTSINRKLFNFNKYDIARFEFDQTMDLLADQGKREIGSWRANLDRVANLEAIIIAERTKRENYQKQLSIITHELEVLNENKESDISYDLVLMDEDKTQYEKGKLYLKLSSQELKYLMIDNLNEKKRGSIKKEELMNHSGKHDWPSNFEDLQQYRLEILELIHEKNRTESLDVIIREKQESIELLSQRIQILNYGEENISLGSPRSPFFIRPEKMDSYKGNVKLQSELEEVEKTDLVVYWQNSIVDDRATLFGKFSWTKMVFEYPSGCPAYDTVYVVYVCKKGSKTTIESDIEDLASPPVETSEFKHEVSHINITITNTDNIVRVITYKANPLNKPNPSRSQFKITYKSAWGENGWAKVFAVGPKNRIVANKRRAEYLKELITKNEKAIEDLQKKRAVLTNEKSDLEAFKKVANEKSARIGRLKEQKEFFENELSKAGEIIQESSITLKALAIEKEEIEKNIQNNLELYNLIQSVSEVLDYSSEPLKKQFLLELKAYHRSKNPLPLTLVAKNDEMPDDYSRFKKNLAKKLIRKEFAFQVEQKKIQRLLQESIDEQIKNELVFFDHIIKAYLQASDIEVFSEIFKNAVESLKYRYSLEVNLAITNLLTMVIREDLVNISKFDELITAAFITYQADVNRLSSRGQTILHLLIELKDSSYIDKLLVLNPRCDIKNNEGLTALSLAIKKHRIEIIEKLLKNPDLKVMDHFDSNGNNLLMQILNVYPNLGDNLSTVSIINEVIVLANRQKIPAFLDMTNGMGQTALMLALRSKVNNFEIMLGSKNTLDLIDYHGQSLFDLAINNPVQDQDLQQVKKLVSLGAVFNAQAYSYCLHELIMSCNQKKSTEYEIIEYLLSFVPAEQISDLLLYKNKSDNKNLLSDLCQKADSKLAAEIFSLFVPAVSKLNFKLLIEAIQLSNTNIFLDTILNHCVYDSQQLEEIEPTMNATPLGYAISVGNINAVKSLLKKGVSSLQLTAAPSDPDITRNVNRASGMVAKTSLLTGRLPHNNETVEFQEAVVDGLGDCGFICLGTDRNSVATLFRSLAASSQYEIFRAELVEEIFSAFRSKEIPTDAEWDKLNDEYSQHDLKQQALLSQIKDELNKSEITEFNFEQLLEWTQKQGYQEETKKLKKHSEENGIIETKMKQYCERASTFQFYVDNLAKNLWIGYKSALLYAKLSGHSLYIWIKDPEEPNKLVLSLFHKSENERQIIHMLHTSAFIHFNLLYKPTDQVPSLIELKAATPHKISVLALALIHFHKDIVDLLLSVTGNKLDQIIDEQGNPLSHTLVKAKKTQGLKYVLTKVSEDMCQKLLSKIDSDGNTLLHLAVIQDNDEILTFLLNKIAGNKELLGVLNFDKKTAAFLAMEHQRYNLLRRLQSAQALQLVLAGPMLPIASSNHVVPPDIKTYTQTALLKSFSTRVVQNLSPNLQEQKSAIIKSLEKFLNEEINEKQKLSIIAVEPPSLRSAADQFALKVSESLTTKLALERHRGPSPQHAPLDDLARQAMREAFLALKSDSTRLVHPEYFRPPTQKDRSPEAIAFRRALKEALRHYFYVSRELYEKNVVLNNELLTNIKDAVATISPAISGATGITGGFLFSTLNLSLSLAKKIVDNKNRADAGRFVQAFGLCHPSAITKQEKDIPMDLDLLNTVANTLYLRYMDQIQQCSLSIESGINIRLAKTDGIYVLANVMADRIYKHIINGGSIKESDTRPWGEKLKEWVSSFGDKSVYLETINRPLPIRCILAILLEDEGKENEVRTKKLVEANARNVYDRENVWQAGGILVKTGIKLIHKPSALYVHKSDSKGKESLCHKYGFRYVNEKDVDEINMFGYETAHPGITDPLKPLRPQQEFFQHVPRTTVTIKEIDDEEQVSSCTQS